MRKLLFVDRDGTLLAEPSDEQVDRLDKVELLAGVIPALLQLKAKGYTFVMVTNQDGLGSKSYPMDDFMTVQQFILKLFSSQGITFAEVLVCPHRKTDGCTCRKPATGLLTHYLADNGWDRAESAMVGDRDCDLELATNLGVKGFRVGTGQGAICWLEIAQTLSTRPRRAEIVRNTSETKIKVAVDLDDNSAADIDTGIGFFDHMLMQLVVHGGIGIKIKMEGDLEVDEHHTVEDTAIALGSAIKQALGDKQAIGRYGFLLPMDEAEAEVAIDLGGRSHFVFTGGFSREKVGELSTEMISHFFASLASALNATIHIKVRGENCHHKIEAMFKGVARSLKMAIVRSDAGGGIPSSKGVI